MSDAEERLILQLKAVGINHDREYRFAALHAGGIGKGLRQRLLAAGLKDWRFDFAVPELRLAIEVEGGGWTGGRHTRGTGFAQDLLKYDAAMRLGWTVYRCDPSMVKSGKAIKTIELLIEMKRSANIELCGQHSYSLSI